MIRLAILGTRGIPNNYGGFERFAEVLSIELAKKGYQISVLKPTKKTDKNIIIGENITMVSIPIPNYFPKNIQTLLYDLKSIIWFSKSGFDLALECGHSFGIWIPFFKNLVKKKIVVNVDGLEHKRSKWSFVGKIFLKTTERLAIHNCASIICDHPEISKYVLEKYSKTSYYIPYGAYIPTSTSDPEILKQYGLTEKQYHLLVARITPENNIDLILAASKSFKYPLVVVGDIASGYAYRISKRYNTMGHIKFLGGIYDQGILNTLRVNCCSYLHGHSVGGTNPSLLEAMAIGCQIVAHNNPFNNYVLSNNGFYFTTVEELMNSVYYIENQSEVERQKISSMNLIRLQEEYSWEIVATNYHHIFDSIEPCL